MLLRAHEAPEMPQGPNVRDSGEGLVFAVPTLSKWAQR